MKNIINLKKRRKGKKIRKKGKKIRKKVKKEKGKGDKKGEEDDCEDPLDAIGLNKNQIEILRKLKYDAIDKLAL